MIIFPKIASIEDFENFYTLRCDDLNIRWTGHVKAPTKESLFNWYLINIKREDRTFFMIYSDEHYKNVAGYLYLDITNNTSNIIDVSYGVLNNLTGKGIGTSINKFAINYACKNFPNNSVLQAWIASDNIGSIKCVLKNGYHKTDEKKPVTFANGEEKIFEKYQYNFEAIK